MEEWFDSDDEDVPAEAERTFPPGTRLGNDLTITGILGEGGTAVVYSAHHSVLEREVAVKVSVGDARESRSRLIREAKMCASVRDPHIPRVYGLDYLEDGSPFLIMEKVDGEVLTRTLARWRLPVRYACDVACELLETLDAIHFAGLLHRDVKPSNVMVDANPDAAVRLRLLDFGVGKILRTDEVDLPELTCKGELLGTPLYMAPEQVLTMPVDERADVYAAGVVLYEMLAGRTPFQGGSIGEVFAAVLRDDITPLRTLRPELPPSLEQVAHRAMCRQRDDRFQTAYAMRVALLCAIQDVVALGPVPAFGALERTPDNASASNLETIQMPYEALTSESFMIERERQSDEWPMDHEESERVSGERLKIGRTVSYLQTLQAAKGR
jgi:serine/threonine protein kinase